MFFILPSFTILLIYVLAAVLPAVYLMRYIYNMDTYEKEPADLLISLVFMGVLAALASIVLEMAGQFLLSLTKISSSSPVYTIITAFLVVAVVEEGMKFLFLYLRSWRDPNFNYRFDGIVYSAFVSLGFAAFENIKYVFGYGLSVAFPRAILAIPGHLGFAVVFGFFYGRAKLAEDMGRPGKKAANLIAGYLAAVCLHGFYDSCAMIGNVLSTVLFVAFVIFMYFFVFRLVRKEAGTDAPI
ncbi:MAG TPA: PrsW family glutamic-type intramembrane protease [Lachnospiraceae bacterium]|nr:PrsW family glutamic-type intramembrane protease [Lachnospiraceae bacterium]